MGIPLVIGVHIGQGQNPTALAEVYHSGWSYTILRLTRLPLGTLYTEVEEFLIERLKILTRDGDYDVKLKVNATGVGSPVINLLRRKVSGLTEVYLTGGCKAEEKEDGLMLPKDLMISHLKVLFQTNRISGSFDKPEPHMTAPEKQRFALFMALKSEILDYETEVQVDVVHWNPKNKTGEHDDLVIALGLACWPLSKEAQK